MFVSSGDKGNLEESKQRVSMAPEMIFTTSKRTKAKELWKKSLRPGFTSSGLKRAPRRTGVGSRAGSLDWPRATRRRGASTDLASAAIGLAELAVQCHQYTSAGRLSIADHWSSICRPIIGKVPTKISNVSSQIIKHQPGSRHDRASASVINPDFATRVAAGFAARVSPRLSRRRKSRRRTAMFAERARYRVAARESRDARWREFARPVPSARGRSSRVVVRVRVLRNRRSRRSHDSRLRKCGREKPRREMVLWPAFGGESVST